MRADYLGTYIYDFELLNNTPYMSLDKIEWWLLKYSDFHSDITAYYKENNIIYIADSVVEPQPHLAVINVLNPFLDFHHIINEVSEYARREAYFEEEIKEYHRIKASKDKSKKWLIKNLKFGLGPYPQFIADANAFGDEKEELLVIDVEHDVVFNLDRDDFRLTLEFLKIFEELFFERGLLPEELFLFNEKVKRRVASRDF